MFKGMPLVLFDFISGKNREDLRDKMGLKNLAILLARIHKNTSRINIKNQRITKMIIIIHLQKIK
jgi:hypothetical protein